MTAPRILLLGAALLAAGLTSCAEETPELFVAYNGVPDSDCLPQTDGLALGSGRLDLFVSTSYRMYPLMRNTLVASEGVSFSRAGGGGGGLSGTDWEANTVSLTSVEISFEAPSSFGVPLGKRVLPLSGSITPSGTLAMGFDVVPSNLGDFMRRSPLLAGGGQVEIRARIQFFGTTTAGRDVDSNEFIFPITLCVGCSLLYPPAASSDPDRRLCDVAVSAEDAVSDLVGVCNPGQDSLIDCRSVCPSPFFKDDPQYDEVCGE